MGFIQRFFDRKMERHRERRRVLDDWNTGKPVSVDWEIEEKRATSRRAAIKMSVATGLMALAIAFRFHGSHRHVEFTSLGMDIGMMAMFGIATLTAVDNASDRSPPRWLYGLAILVGIAGALFGLMGWLHPQP
jgi:hypothetical protein